MEHAVVLTGPPSHPTLRLQGAINLFAVTELHDSACGLIQPEARVTVDCAGVTHLDGSACQVLLALRAGLEKCGGSLALTGASDPVRRYLRLAGMHALLGAAA